MSPSSRTRQALFVAILLGAVAVFLFNLAPYLQADFVEDDAFISLRYAERLLEGHGLTWNDGEFVEGYSNLLWVLGAAALGAVGVDLFQALRVLGLLGTAVAFGATAWHLRPGRTGSVLPGAFALLAFSISQPLIIATASGLETPFVLGFLAVSLALVVRALEGPEDRAVRTFALAGLPLGLLALTRPDGALFTAALALGLVVAVGPGLRVMRWLVALGVTPTLCVVGQLVFRLAYYGDWVPNTAHVKVPGGAELVGEGLVFVAQGLQYQRGLWLFSLLALLPFVLRTGQAPVRRVVIVVLSALLCWTVYVIYTGGVWPMGRRFLAANLLLLVWLAGEGVRALLGWWRGRGGRRPWLVVLVIVAGLSLGWLQLEQWRDQQINRAMHYSFHWKKKGEFFAGFFERCFGARGEPYVALNTAGAIPFYTRWRTLDMLGLMDRWIATHPPDDPAWSLSGHTHGDGAYVLDRQPDIVLFGVHYGTYGGVFTGGRQMHEDPRFYRDYRYVELAREDPPSAHVRIWARLESPVVGLVRREDRVVVPTWFIANESSGPLLLTERLGVPLVAGETATATRIPLSAGSWEVDPVFEEGEGVEWSLAGTTDDGGGTISPGDDGSVDVRLRVDAAPVEGARLVELSLVRRR